MAGSLTGWRTNPRWREDGTELFFAGGRWHDHGGRRDVGRHVSGRCAESALRVPSGNLPNWDVTPDGKRFLVLVRLDPQAPFTVWQNWQSALKP